MKISPTSDFVLIERLDSAGESKGGIILPEVAREKSREARVLAVGPGRMLPEGVRTPMDIKVGDRVLFGPYDAVDIEQGGHKLTLVRQDAILAVLEGN